MRTSLRLSFFGLLFVLASCSPPSGSDGGTVTTACEAGTQGCPCAAGRCGKSANGESLLCMGDVCESMACPAGSDGCVCRGGTACDVPGSSCTNGFCVSSSCGPGSTNCACIAGTCDVGLTCIDSTVCVDSTGYEGGACLANGSCHRGSRCAASTNTCVFCSPGTPGCQCTASNGCSEGLVCAAGACVAATALPPANPKCFTPCPQLMPAGATCSPDGLIAGCFDGLVCTNGSCLPPGAAKASCANDLGCPFFQVCLAGGCYSNCDVNADCASGLGCFKHACRPTCSVSSLQPTCPGGTSCTSNDGQNGFCTPSGTSTAGTSPNPTGGLKVSTSIVELSNVRASADFLVLPRSDITQDVVVRKKWHKVNYANAPPGERVDAPLMADGVTYAPCNAAAGECPLSWLTLNVNGVAPTLDPSITYRLAPNCVDDTTGLDAGAQQACPHVTIGKAGDAAATSWEGELEVSSGQGATITVHLSYVQRPDGQWTGSMYYFGTFKTAGLPAWIGRADKATTIDVDNAFIQRWGAFRGNQLAGWQEFKGVLASTRQGSWDFAEVRRRCATITNGSPTAACYPYTNTAGVRLYVGNADVAAIPSGVVELPIGFNLQIPDPNNAPTRFQGRVESALAMHYPGNPQLKLEFASDPTNASLGMMMGNDRVVLLKGIESVATDTNRLVSTIGGRLVSSDGTCPADYAAVQVPWLVPGFTALTNLNGAGVRSRTECRETLMPFDGVADTQNLVRNRELAGGNPVPDGSPRKRTLKFIDGALVNQTELFLIFEESYESFIPNQAPTTAYGFMTLKRAPANLAAADYVGRPTATVARSAVTPGATCAPALVNQVLGTSFTTSTPVSPAQMATLVDTLILGGQSTAGYAALPTNDNIAYYCEGTGGGDTGFFNGGKDEFTLGIKKACPPGAKVVYFNVGLLPGPGTNKTPQQLANDPCMNGGSLTCWETLQAWKNGPTVVTEYEPFYRCTNTLTGGNNNYCDDTRTDLRLGKTFYRRTTATSPPMLGINALIDRAFRYKTRFRSTTGGSLGFAPRQCIPNSDSVPYCYDPAEIQEARDRVDCLVDLYSRPGVVSGPGNTQGTLADPQRTQLLAFLRSNFSAFPSTPGPGGVTQIPHDAFERLYAELLIMQGDEALTAAYASRFDLAATGGATFKGSAFEANGIDLTGVAGAELFQLYQSVQYYQLALDRLYLLGKNMGIALSLGDVGSTNDFISAETVTSYLERLVRAAAQKSRAWGEIARRYQNFNRPDLSRAVIERAYVGTYVESALISRLMQDIAAGSGAPNQPQMRLVIEKTQRSYRMSLLDMREIYAQLSDQLNYFGFPADYIPFPALDSATGQSGGAFESLLAISKQRLDLAKQREVIALAAGRQGRVDAAQFQADLVSLRNTYENQLATACGTFKGDDGLIYPAIVKYSPQNAIALQLGDPCGRMGNGDIHNASLAAQDSALKVSGILQRHANILQDVSNEQMRMAAVCGVNAAQVDYTFKQAGITSTLQRAMADQKAETAFITGSIGAAIAGLQATSCEAIGCVKAAITGVAVGAMGIASAGTQFSSDTKIARKEEELRTLEANSVKFSGTFQCNLSAANDGGIGAEGLGIIQIESNARVASMLNDTLEVQIEALRADYALRGAVAEVQRMYNNAQRLQNQFEEAASLAIDIQQAQNDPNVRIYQNDAIINADVSFNDALATAYRLTRVYEYYTSQSYARKEQLFLIRMVSSGQYNLENYLLQLENEYLLFGEQFGNPDLRVLVLSLRDDIMNIPRVGTDGQALTEDVRINVLRQKLKDPKRLDARGYLTLPFSTTVGDLSPVTRNHKIHHVEIDLQGVRMGDALARVYLRSAGTGVVRNVNDELDYYVFPERLGVINASVGGAKVFDAEVYRNYRFRDRPLVNTLWELVVNRRDETVNKDIDLGTISDVRVLLYYSDFTSF
ncbi:MAG: hypothetical protein Q8N23_02410 [Archangium sp.]|nr:hypothetical protein [Archangium sp.]MDP3151493.1 hypothetical protein [Archangium sp.]MDP3575385.1 hypothetical protein [Archangium sp.]